MHAADKPRRDFLKLTSAAAAGMAVSACAGGGNDALKPNILWITWEDASPHLGCYGDEYAKTPVLDAFAREGILYEQAFASAPVCTPARSCIITGVHACSQGSQFQRQLVPKSDNVPYFTDYLREAGYYCSNNVKTDFNFTDDLTAWDECSDTAHWRNRNPDQPFFSVFNFMTTHQSQTRYDGEELAKRNAGLPPELRHDPADVILPPYYPDSPVIRENMAAFHTQMTLMDQQVGQILEELEADGLAENTIVFCYSDHGNGLPRGKRWLHDTGTQVAMLVRMPERYRHLAPLAPGETTDQLVSFVDLAPTVLQLAGLPVPNHMQGLAFLGAEPDAPRRMLFTTRDRSAQGLEVNRAIRENRWHYIRNFLSHRPRMQYCYYSEPTPIRVELRRLGEAGVLEGDTAWLLADSLPVEELYDTERDPWEMHNLAEDPAHADELTRLRNVLYDRMVAFRDTSLLPENEIHRRAGDRAPYDMAQRDDLFPVERILEAASLVGMGVEHRDRLIAMLGDGESGVRYWAATGLAVLGEAARSAASALENCLEDESPSVRVAAAEALCRMGRLDTGLPALGRELERGTPFLQYEICAALVHLGRPITPIREQVLRALERDKQLDYTERRHLIAAVGHVIQQFEGQTVVPTGAQAYYDWCYANE